jgi:hypothetical protein
VSGQSEEREDWRVRVEELIERLKHDPDYRALVEADPGAELCRLGLPGPIQFDILNGMVPDLRCVVTCIRGTSACTKSAYT